jgi:hypothetical protein
MERMFSGLRGISSVVDWWIWIIVGMYVLAATAFVRGFCQAAAERERRRYELAPVRARARRYSGR